MKKLITILIALISLSCTGQVASFESLEDKPKQETYYTVYVHSSNIDKIQYELTCDDVGVLVWEKQDGNYLSRIEERIRRLPPAWECGFTYKELKSDNRTNTYRFSCIINDGSYWKLHLKSIDGNILYIEFDTDNIVLGEKMLWIWMEDGKIKHSLNGIVSCNKRDVLLLWCIEFDVTDSFVTVKDTIDLRGYTLDNRGKISR